MAPSRKRARPADDPEDASQTQPNRTQHPTPSDDEGPSTGSGFDSTMHQTLVKGIVRLALASEFSRNVLRMSTIQSKNITSVKPSGPQFRAAFDDAQLALRRTFGMELVELPARDKLTAAQRRKAGGTQATQVSQAMSIKSWILVSTLPDAYKGIETGVLPSRAPTRKSEAEYSGLCSMLVAIIALSGGQLSQAKLDRHLRRMNADVNTPVEKTEDLLKRMIRQGYLVRVKENIGGEEAIDYHVGPRGKIEIGEKGVAGLVRSVWGEDVDEELEKKLDRSLSVSNIRATNAANGLESTQADLQQTQQQQPRQSRRRKNPDDDDDDE